MNKIRINDNKIEISVSVVLFKEKETYIAYCPSLDMSGYDITEDKAKEDFAYNLKEWISEQITRNTLQSDLAAHDWTLNGNESNEPRLTDIVKNNTNAANIVNNVDYRKTNISNSRIYLAE